MRFWELLSEEELDKLCETAGATSKIIRARL